MLRENAQVFSGWNVYIDHESPEAQQARGGLPRSLRDLGGIIEESWWDDTIPPEGRFGQGGVVGRLRPIRDLKPIIQEAPEVARFSIKAKATDVHEGIEEGQQVWVVEGIRNAPPGSVDAVTLDGAGGKVAALLEAQDNTPEHAELELAEAKLKAADRKSLPDSAFAIPEDREYPIQDESHAQAALSMVEAHGSDEQKQKVRSAVKRRYPELDVQESTDSSQEAGEGGTTVKELEEALRDPESPVSQAVKELAEAQAKEQVGAAVEAAKTELQESFETQVEERVSTAVEETRTEERAKTDRERQLRSMRDEAHRLIEAADLGSETLATKLKSQFDLTEAGDPTEDLDLVDKVDGDGKIVKAANDQLVEAVESEIEDARKVLAEANPTEVSGQGGGGGGGEGDKSSKTRKPGKERFWREHIEEAGLDPDEAFPKDKLELAEANAGKED